MRSPIFILVVTMLLFLSGCASSSNHSKYKMRPGDVGTGDYEIDNGVQKAQVRLSEAAISVSDSLNQLSAIEKVNAPRNKLSPPLDADRIGLGGLVSVDWTGPVEPLVLKLANAGHYKFRAVGKNPAIPVLVAVYAENMPLADVLRDANLQAGKKADIVVYPSLRMIELRYR